MKFVLNICRILLNILVFINFMNMFGKLVRCYHNEDTIDTPSEIEVNTSFLAFGRAPAVAFQRKFKNKPENSSSILKECIDKNDITYIDSNLAFVSLAHFSLFVDKDTHKTILVDMSTNGTYLNGKKLNKPNSISNANDSCSPMECSVDGLGLGCELQYDQIISIRFK